MCSRGQEGERCFNCDEILYRINKDNQSPYLILFLLAAIVLFQVGVGLQFIQFVARLIDV